MIIPKIQNYLKERISQLEILIEPGPIPGILDTYELKELTGRLKESKRILAYIEDQELKNN